LAKQTAHSAKTCQKNDSIFSFEQVICSDVARRGQVRAYTLGESFEGAPTQFAVK